MTFRKQLAVPLACVLSCLASLVGAQTVTLSNPRFSVTVDLDRGGLLTSFENLLDGNAELGNLVQGTGVQPVFRGNGYTVTLNGVAATAYNLSADKRSLDVAVENCWNADTGRRMSANLYLRYELHDAYLLVAYSFIDRTGLTSGVSNHEMPALYAVSRLSKFSCYCGAAGWTGGALSSWSKPPFWGANPDAYKPMSSDETWGAWTDETSGLGFGVYTPGVNYMLAGRTDQNALSVSPSDPSSSYVAPILQAAPVSGQTLSGVYYLTAGNLETIRRTFAAIASGVADGQGLGTGDLRVDAAADGFSFGELYPSSRAVVLNGRFISLNGERASADFALVCRTNLADEASELLVPVDLTLEEPGENVKALARMQLDAAPSAMFLTGLALRPSTYADRLRAKGFPESYVNGLAVLNEAHPNWVFEPLPVADLTWDEIVDKESTPKWNLVVYSTWASGAWLSLGAANYTPYYAENAQAYDSGTWYQASRAAIAYFMDPRNFFNETEIFMFETLEFDSASQNEVAVEKALAGSFLAGACYDGGARSYAALLVESGREQGVSPVFLAGRVKQEQGNGTVQAMGTIGDSLWSLYADEDGKVGDNHVWGTTFQKDNAATAAVIAQGKAAFNGYYNFFNMQASGTGLFEIRYNAWMEAHDAGAEYCGPWTSQERAIRGGVIKMKEKYIGTHRHTRYLQKFSVLAEAGSYRWLQYMQNIASPLTEARNAHAAFVASDALNDAHLFLIPVYTGLPKEPCPDPARGNSVYSATK